MCNNMQLGHGILANGYCKPRGWMGPVPLQKTAFNFCMQDNCVDSSATKCFVTAATETKQSWLCRPSGEYSMSQAWKDVVILWNNLIDQKFKYRKGGFFFSPRKFLSKEEVSLVRGHPYCPTKMDHPGLSHPIYSSYLHSSYTTPEHLSFFQQLSRNQASLHSSATQLRRRGQTCTFSSGKQITTVLQQSQMHTNTQKRLKKATMFAPKGWWINSQHWERERGSHFHGTDTLTPYSGMQ